MQVQFINGATLPEHQVSSDASGLLGNSRTDTTSQGIAVHDFIWILSSVISLERSDVKSTHLVAQFV